MQTLDSLRIIIGTFPEVEEAPHFDRIAFKVKKIFATYDAKTNSINVKLSEVDQDVFTKVGQGAIYPVDNKWGKQGWTTVDLSSVTEELLKDVLTTAYCEVAPKKLVEQLQKDC